MRRTVSANTPKPVILLNGTSNDVDKNIPYLPTVEDADSPARQKRLDGVKESGYAFPMRIREFNVNVVLACPSAPCQRVQVHVDNTYFTTSRDILEAACLQLQLNSEKYDLYYKGHNVTETRSTMGKYHNGGEKFILFPGMEFELLKRIPRPTGFFGCIRSYFGYTCPRMGGARKSLRKSMRKQKRSIRTRRNR
jgi:hypothetical protein